MIGVKIRRLRLSELKRACASAFNGWTPEAKLLSDAYEEALVRFKRAAKRERWDAKFVCNNCNAPSADKLESCWACGWLFKKSERCHMNRSDLERVAKDLGIEDIDLMNRSQLVSSIQRAETAQKRRSDCELLEIEARELNAKLGPLMPPGWVRKAATMGTTYFDPRGRRRIFIPNKGIAVLFAVKDGELDGRRNLVHYDKEERQRRHIGRSNYQYVSDFSREVLTYCVGVFDLYGTGG